MRYFLFAVVLLSTSCAKREESLNKFSDATILKIYDLKDRRASDSLYNFFKHENSSYRKEAALAFGSIQDSTAISQLALLLNDQDTAVLNAAIFAIGQTRCRASEQVLQAALNKANDDVVRGSLTMAFGKVCRQWKLPEGFNTNAPQLMPSLAWSLYFAGLNGATDSTANALAVKLLSSENPASARLGAAHFLSRSGKKLDSFFSTLKDIATTDTASNVRMSVVSTLRKIVSDSTLQVLKSIAAEDKNYRVRVNAIRAMQAFPFSQTKGELLNLVLNKNDAVAVTASEVIKAKIDEASWIEVANKAALVPNWRAQANLYEAACRAKYLSNVVDEIKTLYSKATSPFQKAALINALQYHPGNFDFLAAEFEKADTAVLKTSTASAIASIDGLRNTPPNVHTKVIEFYHRAIDDGDPGVIGIVASALVDPALGYKNKIKDISFLKNARAKLRLPKDFESVEPLDRAIAFLEGKQEPGKLVNEYNHPIDWVSVKNIPADQLAFIYTTRGKITIRLFVEEAPGSVMNFIQLAQSGYFNHKAFHRVVPNFVIQGGCNRGDGSGGLDYSIRSEFSQRRYKTGSVGMASAGKDTEGTQWFITHSPTPHLDGRYTIFAEVVQGIEAVHQMEVGDEITDVKIGIAPSPK